MARAGIILPEDHGLEKATDAVDHGILYPQRGIDMHKAQRLRAIAGHPPSKSLPEPPHLYYLRTKFVASGFGAIEQWSDRPELPHPEWAAASAQSEN
jgi:hypothetical protein